MTRPHLAESPGEDVGTLIDALIREQQQLSAVEAFSALHDSAGPALEGQYRHLIPLTAPRPGEQYGFQVDLDRCSGCKGCVTACHSLNGLEPGESWREVGLLVGEAILPRPAGAGPGSVALPVQRTVTTACHHCIEPACLLGCPVLAYDKEPVTGIVRHLDDQCIGCSYCIMTCPYEVPKFSKKRGIVRKCDLCHGRLSEGEAPACVQACPNQAIQVKLVSREWVRLEFRPPGGAKDNATASGSTWLPDAPQPGITLPTTRYLTRNPDVSLVAADHFESKPQPAHVPLILLLIGTQAGMGGMAVAALMRWIGAADRSGPGLVQLGLAAMALFGVGMLGSVAHLGRPQKAWRVWMGWRTSWLSREAMILPVFGAVAGGTLTDWMARLWIPEHWISTPVAAPVVAAVWIVALLCLIAQTQVYASTARWSWRVGSTFPRFVGSSVILGSALALAVPAAAERSAPLLLSLVVASVWKLVLEVRAVTGRGIDARWKVESDRQIRLLTGPLRIFWGLRVSISLLAGIALPLGMLVGSGKVSPMVGVSLFLGALSGEVLERWLFFRAAAQNRMPGMP
jgi:Fe-S-cluster-containing dehydrogenase component/DMSO reductase anchor subunit